MSQLKIIHDRDNCIGCNSCVTIAPQNWFMDEKIGKAKLVGSQKKGRVYVAEIFEIDKEANQMAAQACPMQIIKVSNG